MNTSTQPLRWKPSVPTALLVYLGYLAIFYTTWYVNGIEYNDIGRDAMTAKLWYALPTLFGSTFLIIILWVLGWWRLVLFDNYRAAPKWAWVLPIVMVLVIANNLLGVDRSRLTPELLLWVTLGGVGVGIGEETITRGALLIGLRANHTEKKAWLYSTLLFSALHIPNALFGLPVEAMLAQLVLTFIMGSGLYVVRRISGTLILPIILHGLWDSSLFASEATRVPISMWQWVVYPIAIVCLVGVFRGK